MTKHASAGPTSSGFGLATKLRLTFVAALVAAALAGGAGCSHAHSAGDGAKSAHAARVAPAAPDHRREQGRGEPAGRARGASAARAHRADLPDRIRSSAEPGAPMLATSPVGTLRPEALREIQRRLTSRGLLAGDHSAGDAGRSHAQGPARPTAGQRSARDRCSRRCHRPRAGPRPQGRLRDGGARLSAPSPGEQDRVRQ